MNNQELLKKIVSHCKEYGFVYPSSEIYDGLSAVYDYGPYGSLLKNNIKEFWWKLYGIKRYQLCLAQKTFGCGLYRRWRPRIP